MSLFKKEYFYAQTLKNTLLPHWFVHAHPRLTKTVRVLGATFCFKGLTPEEVIPVPQNTRLHGNFSEANKIVLLPDGTALADPVGFIMMVNNYTSEKEYDVSFKNLPHVNFIVTQGSAPPDLRLMENEVYDIMVEMELRLIETD
jgi:hypothetical protein